LHLVEGGARDNVRRFLAPQQAKPTGINQRERAAPPLRFGGDTIAGDTRLIMNDGDAPTDNAIEERRFADVRSSHNGDKSCHEPTMVQFAATRKSKRP